MERWDSSVFQRFLYKRSRAQERFLNSTTFNLTLSLTFASWIGKINGLIICEKNRRSNGIYLPAKRHTLLVSSASRKSFKSIPILGGSLRLGRTWTHLNFFRFCVVYVCNFALSSLIWTNSSNNSQTTPKCYVHYLTLFDYYLTTILTVIYYYLNNYLSIIIWFINQSNFYPLFLHFLVQTIELVDIWLLIINWLFFFRLFGRLFGTLHAYYLIYSWYLSPESIISLLRHMPQDYRPSYRCRLPGPPPENASPSYQDTLMQVSEPSHLSKDCESNKPINSSISD